MTKRNQPKQEAPPAVTPRLPEHLIVQERTYSLITPLFGGGAIPGERDEDTIIRGTEIRGHLRFWWRACYGGRYSSVAEMKNAEDRIWGAAATSKKDEKESVDANQELAGEGQKEHGTVQIVVETTNKGQAVEPFEFKSIKEKTQYAKNQGRKKNSEEYWSDQYNPASEVPRYAAFMFQLNKEEKEKEKPPARKFVYKNVKFKLLISFPEENRADIEGALWAWETFGGIGARTRRGFGALHLDRAERLKQDGKRTLLANELPTPQNVVDWLERRFNELGVEQKAPDDIPSLSKNLLEKQIHITPSSLSAANVWKTLIENLATFRQPDRQSNRWLDTKESKRLRNAGRASSQQTYKFPKAVLGLPIVFHFADKGKDGDLTLQGAEEGRDRLASALILRPLACQKGYVGVALLLENHVENATFPPGTLKVVTKEQKPLSATIEATLEPSDTADTFLNGGTDVWKACMEHFKKYNQGQNNSSQRGRKR